MKKVPNTRHIKRRDFIVQSSAALGLVIGANNTVLASAKKPLFNISLAQWSLHRALQSGQLNNLNFPAYSKKIFNIDAVEYVNQFFKDKANDKKYLNTLKQRCMDHGVKSLLIMCDGEGKLGDPNTKQRQQAVENHYKWVNAARILGCHSIRVNAASKGSYKEQYALAVDGLRKLSEFGDQQKINIIVENHGGLSSNGQWLSEVIKGVDHPRCGTLPDFGNFKIDKTNSYDRYKGVRQLMPFAKGVSAKSHDFDTHGEEIHTNFKKMLNIVLQANYRGYIGIEYEGNKLSEVEGIKRTQALLEKYRIALAKAHT